VLLLPLASSSAQSFPVVRSAPAAGGEWSWPVAGPRRLERAFDPPAHEYGAGHRGIDIGAAPGAPISSPADGIVLFAGPVAGRSVVTVDHGGGVVSSFDPVIPSVVTGTIVTRDTVIGHLEAGRSMHCVDGCLHLGARLGGVYIDPLPLFGRPVRSVLLPVGG
jgi:murein DD-endopeptidase MepM/ murein hydrolase activator NlpD